MSMRPHRVALAVTDGMPIFEASVPCEIFGIDRPDLATPWYSLTVLGLGDQPVQVGPGFWVHPCDDARALVDADTIVVPACANVHVDPPRRLVEAVRAAHERGTRLLSICSGAFVLAAAGVLDGRRATTHWMHAAALAHRYPSIEIDPTVLYVDDGDIITSAGTAAGIDACLHVVRVDHGAAVASELARRLVTPPHRQGGQAQYARESMRTDDDWLAPLLDWARVRLEWPLTVPQLALQASVSTRTLERKFLAALGRPPLHWLVLERVSLAQQLLESTDKTIEAIAETSGFGGAANMRTHFKRHVGVSPATYRRTFQSPPGDTGGGRDSLGLS